MFIVLLVNIFAFNSGYQIYAMLDFYQLLYLILFLNVDYSPALNSLLNGFRYSHLLFLPQIFDTGALSTLNTSVSDKFGILIPDSDFLTNTGHYFLVLFILIVVFYSLKLIVFVCKRVVKNNEARSNKITNQGELSEKDNPPH